MFGLIARVGSMFWKWIDLMIFERTGSHYMIFEIFNLFLQGLAESIIMSLIVLIGYGIYFSLMTKILISF
jgi:hypothetical protein